MTVATPVSEIAGEVAALEATDLGEPPLLRSAMAERGYVYLPGLVPSADLATLDARQGELLERVEWATRDGAGRLQAVESGAVRADKLASSRDVQRGLFAAEELHRLGHHPALFSVVAALLDTSEVLRHPRPVARVTFPVAMNGALPTPPHQDHLGMQGTTETYTAWIALENCRRDEGGLAVAEASHLDGPRPLVTLPGARVAPCATDGLEGRWRSADYRHGDVLVFHSLTVHAALPNRSRRLRRSVDCRYQRVSDPICEVALRDQTDLTWDTVYADWGSDELKRYWERHELNVVPHDPTLGR